MTDIVDPSGVDSRSTLYYGIPILYKRDSSLPNKATFRDFYPYDLTPKDSNLKELRRALANLASDDPVDDKYQLNYCGVKHEATVNDLLNSRAFLLDLGSIIGDKGSGPLALVLDPIARVRDEYAPLKEGEDYYSRSSSLIPTPLLIEKFITVESKYIGDFEYMFGFPPSLLLGLFSYGHDDARYPSGTVQNPVDSVINKLAEFPLFSPYSLKNFSGVSKFLESVTRMILMDVMEQSILHYEKDGIASYYWNTKIQGLRDGRDVEDISRLILNISLDLLYMAIHSNYYATGVTQNIYIHDIRNGHLNEYDSEKGDSKFKSAKYGFHAETVASYALYPFISMIYSGFLSGFSPSAMKMYGHTVFRTFIVKQLRWFRYSWPYEMGYSPSYSTGAFWEGARGDVPWSRHNILYFASLKDFRITKEDVSFLKKVLVNPLQEFIKDYDAGGEIRRYATDKDRSAAGVYSEYTSTAVDWLDGSLIDGDLADRHPGVGFEFARRDFVLEASGDASPKESMLSWVRGILAPYVEGHEETGYSPYPHLFSARGLFKHYLNPYGGSIGNVLDREELAFYKGVFEKNPFLKDMVQSLGLVSPPLAQPIDEYRFNILVTDEAGGIGDVTGALIDYYSGNFSPNLPFRPLPVMALTPIPLFDVYTTYAESSFMAEMADIPFSYGDKGLHLPSMYEMSARISTVILGVNSQESFDEAVKSVAEIKARLPFQVLGFNYYYYMASNSGNFFYKEETVEDMNTGEKAPLFIQSMNELMAASSGENASDEVYMKALPKSWIAYKDPNHPYFRSDALFSAINSGVLFDEDFQYLLDWDVLLMSIDSYKSEWSSNHNGASPNAYTYCLEVK